MKKSSFILMSMLLVFTMFVAGCGKSENNNASGETPKTETETPKESEAPKKDVSLRVFSTFGGTDTAREAFQAALDEFTSKNPNIKVENDTMSANDDGFRTKVNTDMTSGNEPDLLFYFVGADAKGFVDAGKVVPLNDILDSDSTWKSGFTPAALENVRQKDGNIYAAPLTGFYEGLFVNKKIFEDNKLELPTDWDKMKTAVQTLSKKGIIPLAAPFDQSHYVIEHFILSAAGSKGHNSGLADGIDPNWEKGYAAMKELYDLGAFPKDAATIDLGMASNYYGEGKAAMILEGSWAMGNWKDPAVLDNTTVIPFPAMPGGVGTGKDVIGGFGSGFYLSKSTFDNADKKDAAIALLKHMTSPAVIEKIALANGGTPAAAGVEIKGKTQTATEGFAMVANADSVNNPIDTMVAPETFSTLRAGVQAVVTGKKTPADVLKEAKDIEDANKK
ncbi:extracellular solute-binding protein [Paenibacillus donghaensis]|uniref:ABC transporter substrate-binding protein n=1 Tax=Paenibacillus donghaensis TaxID=414771 RepID=UPI00188370EF|nr:extracellular solute-binding protein [Paenibacillus donghaensis]MBE9916070.1 extracellular solute-binding protein [Paenibacillus donghaensis]